jgi:hypothetical protein
MTQQMKMRRVLLVLSACYGLLLIARYSFVAGGIRWFCPADDVWITMSYARTWVESGVLAWYPTAPVVQGFSSWAWVLLLSPLEAIKVPPQTHGLFVQLLGWLIMCATVFTVSRLTTVDSHMTSESSQWGLVATALVGFNWPLWNLAIQGWEHSAVVLCVAILCVILVRKEW